MRGGFGNACPAGHHGPAGRPAVNYLLAGAAVEELFTFFVPLLFLCFLAFFPVVEVVLDGVEDPWAAETVVIVNGKAKTPTINSIANFFIFPPD